MNKKIHLEDLQLGDLFSWFSEDLNSEVHNIYTNLVIEKNDIYLTYLCVYSKYNGEFFRVHRYGKKEYPKMQVKKW